MKPFALLLLPTLALATAPARAPAPRAAALLVALDPQAEGLVPRMEADLSRALGTYDELQVRTPEALYGQPVDPGAQAALERAKGAYADALSAFVAKKPGRAEERVRASLQEVPAAAAAMRGCTPLCDATALLAGMLLERGEPDDAKHALLDLMALDPTYALSPQRFRRELLALRAEVGTSHAAALRGSATVVARPAGARVYLDGEALGYAPVSIPALAVGAHLVRVERPGFRTEGQLLQAGADEQTVTVALTATPAYSAARAKLDAVVRELGKEAPSPAAVALGKSLGLERALLGSVRTLPDGAGSELALALYELGSGKRLALRRMKLQGDEFGQLQGELERLVNHLFAEAAGGSARAVQSSDPLDHTQGTEEWSGEDRGGKSRQAEKKRKATDPLDTVSGTEDW
ncbi:PEGA domain-containing protein [Aggregicoccus sp. 17bor-14]|uniref:PEGA domain-containing protein n=1 Tax=Myxococcaceae TaxID=31 RepID=UPI00129D13C5|nr:MULTISPECIES: PEGA domain-containing protein [Myxococcaceae]MBF5044887.1 PEGA domain-containing protein [Simulacricoccus sp. 17bor-14]MRI90631.1 PEGA domain-containing protein [Aggregicoccus sp. 17bor-14]